MLIADDIGHEQCLELSHNDVLGERGPGYRPQAVTCDPLELVRASS
jgi:hypothetical protein